MRSSDQTKNTGWRYQNRDESRRVNVIAFVLIASWCGQSHASNLWLWGWLGVADIQIMQDAPTSPAKDKANLTSVALAKTATPVPAKFPDSEPAKKSANLTKTQSGDDARNKNGKDRPFKIIIM